MDQTEDESQTKQKKAFTNKKLKRNKDNDDLAAATGAISGKQSQPIHPQNIPSHLFSAFKYWMSKRMDLLSPNAASNDLVKAESSNNLIEQPHESKVIHNVWIS